MRDDKSYPYILLTDKDQWPRLSFHQGPKKQQGTYFGPYPSVNSVRESMSLLQRVFKVRQCEDSFLRIDQDLVFNIKSIDVRVLAWI